MMAFNNQKSHGDQTLIWTKASVASG
jgi:hypothetical protein